MVQNIESTLNLVNKKAFERADVIEYYQMIDHLFPSERLIIERFRERLKDSRLLDIGIGGGRTTRYLADIAGEYVGIDYVPEYIEVAKGIFPDADLQVGDARDLSRFPDGSFDFVLFSYNGLGTLSHEGRLETLSEMHRVLKPQGVLIFSAHNRDYKYFNRPPWRWTFRWNLSHIKFILHSLYHLPKHAGMKRLEHNCDEYSLVNDGDHRYALLFYYINVARQQEQLRNAGFLEAEAYDIDGNLIEGRSESHWIYYVAVKR